MVVNILTEDTKPTIDNTVATEFIHRTRTLIQSTYDDREYKGVSNKRVKLYFKPVLVLQLLHTYSCAIVFF